MTVYEVRTTASAHVCTDPRCWEHACSLDCNASFQNELGTLGAPPVEARVLRPLLRVGTKALHETLRVLPQSHVRDLLSRVNLQSASVTMDSAKRLHEGLYRQPLVRRSSGIRDLALPLTFLVRAPCGLDLDMDDCAALLAGGTRAESVLERRPPTAGLLHDAGLLPPEMRRAGLGASCMGCQPPPPLAVGLLVADSATPPEIARSLAPLWAAMRARRPGLPLTPVTLDELITMGSSMSRAQRKSVDAFSAKARACGASPDRQAHRAPTSAEAPTLDPDELAERIRALHDGFSVAREAAKHLAGDFGSGRRPRRELLEEITRATAEFDRVRQVLTASLETAPDSLQELEHGLSLVRAASYEADLRARFVSASGPEQIESTLARIRSAAADSTETAPLRALAELADQVALDAFSPQASEMFSQAQQVVPAEWNDVLMAAVQGRLVLGPPGNRQGDRLPSGGPEQLPSPQEQSQGETGSAAPSEQQDSAPEPLTGLDARLAQDSAAGPDSSEQPVSPADMAIPEGKPSGTGTEQPVSTPAPHGVGEQGQTAEEPAASVDTSTAEAEPTDSPKPFPPSGWTGLHDPQVRSLELEALRQGRFALSGWLYQACGAPEHSVAVRFAAAVAQHVLSSSGELGENFRERAQELCADPPQTQADRLLAWSAALRAGLVAPRPETLQLLEQTYSVNSDRPALKLISEAFRDAARRGVSLDAAGSTGHLRDTAQCVRERDRAVRRAQELREHAATRRINYQRASEMWRRMVSPNGALWDLIDIPAQDDRDRLEECQRRTASLRRPEAVESLIDEVHATVRGRSRTSRKRIEAGARAALRRNIDELCESARSWVKAVTELRALESGEDGATWSTRLLAELRTTVAEQWKQARQELDATARGTDQALEAAAHGARLLLDDIGALLRGDAPCWEEPDAVLLIAEDMLRVPGARVLSSGRCAEPPSLADIRKSLQGEPNWAAACSARIERKDLAGAYLVANAVRQRTPDLADRLTAQVDDHVAQERGRLAGRVETFRDTAALYWHHGSLSEEEAGRLREHAERLSSDTVRRDFDVMQQELDDLRAQAERIRWQRVEDRKAEVLREAESSDPVALHKERLLGYLSEGLVTTADEIMARLKKNERVPEEDSGHDHFTSFFPRYPQVLERTRDRRGKDPRHPVLAELRRLLKNGPESGQHRTTTAQHGEILSELLQDQDIRRDRTSAYEAIRQWSALSQGPNSSGNKRTAIGAVLRLLGMEGTVISDRSDPDRRAPGVYFLSLDLNGAGPTGEALLPAFGSKMSPGGDRLRLVLLWGRPEPRQFTEWLRITPQGQTVLILYFGLLTCGQRRELATLARGRSGPVTGVVDDAVITYLAALGRPQWSTTVQLIAPFSVTWPFQAERMIPEEMFYGRREALDAVMASSGAHFVYGGRQLGKSVLLAEAERRLRREGDRTVVIGMDIYDVGRSQKQVEYLWRRLGSVLSERGIVSPPRPAPGDKDEVCTAIGRWSSSHPGHRLLIFLDEADEFLNLDAEEHDFASVVAFRQLMNATENRVKVVFAGLHKIARFRSWPNQPFANLGEPLGIGPLSSRDAFQLLVRPLRTLGFNLPEALAVSIIAQANNAPALVQYFGDLLLRRLYQTAPEDLPYKVTAEDVNAVQADPDISKAFRDRFEWTLDLDRRYKVIAYVVALHTMDNRGSTVEEKELWEQCREWWPTGFGACPLDEFRSLIEECVDLGVLIEEQDAYRLRTPHILTLLGGAGRVERELLGAEELYQRPGSFDSASYRPSVTGRPELSPLTASQVAQLAKPSRRVRLVVCSEAMEARWVPTVLAKAAGDIAAACHQVGGQDRTLRGEFRRAAGQRSVLVMKLGADPQRALQLIEEADGLLRGSSGHSVSVVAMAGPEHAELMCSALGYPLRGSPPVDDLLERTEVVELRRFGRSGVSQWRLLDHFSRLADESVHSRLLQVTGGWPVLVNRVIRNVVGEGMEAGAALDRLIDRLAVPEAAAEFLEQTGVDAHPAVQAAWTVIVDNNLAAPAEEIAFLLENVAAEEWESLASVARHGPVGCRGLVEVLRGLGALVPDGAGRLAPEQRLASVHRSLLSADRTATGRRL